MAKPNRSSHSKAKAAAARTAAQDKRNAEARKHQSIKDKIEARLEAFEVVAKRLAERRQRRAELMKEHRDLRTAQRQVARKAGL